MENLYQQSLSEYLGALLAYNKIIDLKIKMLMGDKNVDASGSAKVIKSLFEEYSTGVVSALKALLQLIMVSDFYDMPLEKIQRQFSRLLSTLSESDNVEHIDMISLKELAISCYLKLELKSNLPQFKNLLKSISKVLDYCSAKQ